MLPDHKILLTDPVVIHRQSTAVGPMLACSHWLLFNKDNTIKIKSDRIVALIPDLEDNALTHYLNFVQNKDKVMSQDDIQQEEKAYSRLERKLQELIHEDDIPEANTTIH